MGSSGSWDHRLDYAGRVPIGERFDPISAIHGERCVKESLYMQYSNTTNRDRLRRV